MTDNHPVSRSGQRPFIVGIGGTTKPNSSTERVLSVALKSAEALGARTHLFGGPFLAGLPIYAPENPERTEAQRDLVEMVRQADGVLIATPAYHAGISGMIKNAIDLLEDLRADERPYLDGRAIGIIVTAYGWQGGGTTLISVRTIIHALRGWPTPLAVTLNTAEPLFDETGACTNEKAVAGLGLLAAQVVGFADRTL